jgi:hypothetical protein
LAKQAQNPIASLISVPFQNNFNFNAGTQDDPAEFLNIQRSSLVESANAGT